MGLIGFKWLVAVGAHGQCWPVIDSVFHSAGYESCGLFGALCGVAIGSLIGVIIARIIKVDISRASRILLIFLAVFLPLGYAVVATWPFSVSSYNVLIILPITIVFNVLSVVATLFILLIGKVTTFFSRLVAKS